MSGEVKWEAPPPVSLSRVTKSDPELAAFSEALRSRPGEWAVYPRNLTAGSASVTARNIKRGVVSNWQPAGSFEAVRRLVDDKPRLYVRYVGGDTA